jgi:carbon storage regulator CsrA
MLVLSRRVGEMIFLPSHCAYVQVLSVKDGTDRLSIEAPRKVLVLREELLEPQNSERCVDASPSPLSRH